MRTLVASSVLLAACTGSSATGSAGPSPILAGFDPQPVLGLARARMRAVTESGHRTGVRIEPPDHMFTTWSVVGAIDDPALGEVLDATAAACVAHVKAHGGQTGALSAQRGAVSDAVLRAMTMRALPADADAVQARHCAFTAGGRNGFITVVAVRVEGQPGVWRLAGAIHEP
ncbi:MAG TPA: hypothetical protein VK081_11120 [Planctomycetota bacterium]|nr:hypothetical protein [Planctomycetota bacterium]